MSGRARFFVLPLLLPLFFAAGARAEETLTWRDCVNEAKKNHPDLIAARENLNQALAARTITTSARLPQVSASAAERTSKASSSDRTESFSYGVSGKQLLFDGFKTAYDSAAAAENVKSAQYAFDLVSSQVRERLRAAFIELLKTQELLVITENIASRRKQNLELVKLRYEAGREHKGSLLTAEANLAQAGFETDQARRNVDLARRRLLKEMGRTEFAAVKVTGDFTMVSSPAETPDFNRLAENHPRRRELAARTEATRFGEKSARAYYFPQLYANASADRSDADWPPRDSDWSAGLSLSLPLFEGGSRKAKIGKAAAALDQARADERSGYDAVVLTLAEVWKGLQDAAGNVDVQQKFLAAAEERAKIAQAQYSSGFITFDNWTIIEDDLVSARKTFLNTQANTLIAEANWIQAKGGTLDDEK